MSLTCLTCRKIVPRCGQPSPGSCPDCGGELVGSEGAWLEWAGSGGEGHLMLSGDEHTVGRKSENDLVLKDAKVSKVHAVFHREGSDWYVRDAGSANGTFVNGQPVAEHSLSDGDVVSLGKTEIRFHLAGAPSGMCGVTIVPRSDMDDAIQACLSAEPGDFPPASRVEDDEELRQDYERLRTAHLFNSYMGREQDEKTLVRNILKFAFEWLPADRGAILLREEQGAPLVPSVVLYRASSSGEMNIPDSILKRAVEDRSAVLSGDATVDLRFKKSRSVLSENVRSAMCVPLVGKEEVVGAIHLDTREKTSAFTVKDLQFLSTLAVQAASIIEQSRLYRRLEAEARTRQRLSRFLARELLQEVVERGLDLGGEARTGLVTVLFCDIRDFSALAESMEPTQLVRMLNAFFERIVDVVFRHAGMLDKFIGDAVMAVWGAPIQHAEDASRALAASRDILLEVELFNKGSRGQGWPELEVGVGLNTGEVVIGTVGSSRRMEYTVMGDTVNLAARVCGLATGSRILATLETIEKARGEGGVPPPTKALEPARVRGRKKPVHLCEVLGK